jgi:hypothetical protein
MSPNAVGGGELRGLYTGDQINFGEPMTNAVSMRVHIDLHIADLLHGSQANELYSIHCKNRISFFLSPAGMSLTKHSLAGNNLILPDLGEFG